jgi:hypothetical protein
MNISEGEWKMDLLQMFATGYLIKLYNAILVEIRIVSESIDHKMANLSSQIQKQIQSAVEVFWKTRSLQKASNRSEQSNRGAVTGGKQLDGFIRLISEVAIEAGVPREWIFTKSSNLPGFFRPMKEWDFLIISPQNKLLVATEFKSQVGSFGNNFNNRTEEAIGSAVDLWTAFREDVFPDQDAPWVGYVMVVEKTEKSNSTVKVRKSEFEVRSEFLETSYLDRYHLLCRKLVQERHYTSTGLIWTSSDQKFGSMSEITSLEAFLSSMAAYLKGKVDPIH